MTDLGGDLGGDLGTGTLSDLGTDVGFQDPADTVGGLVDTGLQSDLTTTLSTEQTGYTGYYLGAFMDSDLWYGLTSGTRDAGHYFGNAAVQTGAGIGFDFTGLPVVDTGTYTGFNVLSLTPGRTAPLPNGTLIPDLTDIQYDNLGDLIIWTSKYTGPAGEFSELGFVGRPTTSSQMPGDGFSLYHGPGVAGIVDLPVGIIEPEGGTLDLWANFYNKRFLGMSDRNVTSGGGDDYTEQVLMYGTISGTGITNAKLIFLGERDPVDGGDPMVMVGSGLFGQFYGRQAQGLGLAGSGNLYTLASGADVGDFRAAAAGHKELADPYTVAQSAVAPKAASVFWQGYVAGVAENLVDDMQSAPMISHVPSQFTMTINQATGTATGSLAADDGGGPLLQLVNVQVGGASGSAYVNDRAFLAELGGSNVVDYNAVTGNLKPYGNVLWTSDGAAPWSPDVTWGYWAASFNKPSTSTPYQFCGEEAYWIAGAPTPGAEVQSLLTAGTLVAHYNGGAACTEYYQNYSTMNASFTEMYGSSHLVVNFTSATQSVGGSLPTFTSVNAKGFAGNLDFGSKNIEFQSQTNKVTLGGFSDKTATGIQIKVNGSSANGEVNGGFYGPNARSAAGNFKVVQTIGTDTAHYTGVFGGQR